MYTSVCVAVRVTHTHTHSLSLSLSLSRSLVLSHTQTICMNSVHSCGVHSHLAAHQCCSVMQRVASCCSVLQRVSMYCSVLQRVALCIVRCSALQCVALYTFVYMIYIHTYIWIYIYIHIHTQCRIVLCACASPLMWPITTEFVRICIHHVHTYMYIWSIYIHTQKYIQTCTLNWIVCVCLTVCGVWVCEYVRMCVLCWVPAPRHSCCLSLPSSCAYVYMIYISTYIHTRSVELWRVLAPRNSCCLSLPSSCAWTTRSPWCRGLLQCVILVCCGVLQCVAVCLWLCCSVSVTYELVCMHSEITLV